MGGENLLINEVYYHNFQFLFSIQSTFTISIPLAPGQIVTTAQVKNHQNTARHTKLPHTRLSRPRSC